jgi:hypothetical protein
MAYIKSMFNRLMLFSWEKHQILSRNVAKAADKDMGFAIALMGVGLTLLSKDLLLVEQQQSLSESSKNTFC